MTENEEEKVNIPIHLLGLSYIGDIAGRPVFAREADAAVVRMRLTNLREAVEEWLKK